MNKIFLCGLGAITLVVCVELYGQQEEGGFLDRQGIFSLAILPPIGQSIPNATREVAVDLFSMKLKLKTSMRIVRPDNLVARLEQSGLMGEFSGFITLLSQTGMINKEALKRMGETVDADALLLIHVLDYEEEKGSWWYGRGGKNLCRIQYSLFRASDGEKVWESLEFRQHDSKLSTNPYPMERVIGDVSEKAVTSLLTGRQNADVRRK